MKKILITMLMFITTLSFSARSIEVSLKTLDNKKIELSDYKGKPTYIKLWASWCPICLNTLAETDEFFKEKDNTFNKISIVSPTFAGEMKEKDFIKWYNGLNYKNIVVLMDLENILVNKLRIRGFPANVFVNSEGEVELVRFGHMTKEEIRDRISKLK